MNNDENENTRRGGEKERERERSVITCVSFPLYSVESVEKYPNNNKGDRGADIL